LSRAPGIFAELLTRGISSDDTGHGRPYVHALGESRFGLALQYATVALDALSSRCQRRFD